MSVPSATTSDGPVAVTGSTMMVDPTPLAEGFANVLGPPAATVGRTDPLPAPRSQRLQGLQGLEGALTGTRLAAVHAERLAPRDLLLAQGAIVPCVLETQLISNIAGFASCIVTENIYSDDGHTLLIERGSHVTGEYQSNARSGETRLFVLWNRIKTPNGVVVSLDSPGGDAVGGQGLPGAVDNHWFERIGAAFLLSLIQDAVAIDIARQSASRGEAVTTINASPTNTVEAAEDLSKEMLKGTINIAPTLYKNRGELLSIIVARDLWFDHVYRID